MPNITRQQLIALLDQLCDSQQSWNDCAETDDRGRDNKSLVLILGEDGSGYLGDTDGVRNINIIEIPDVIVQGEFETTEEAADALIEMHNALDIPRG